jgi:hypothetical protein
MAAAVTAAGLAMGVQSYRDRIGWGPFLIHVAWVLPIWLTFMTVFLVALRLFVVVVQSGSLVLMAVAGAAVAFVGAAWRSRPVRAYLQILKNRPRAWWMRMLVIASCALVVGTAALLLWLLRYGGLGPR